MPLYIAKGHFCLHVQCQFFFTFSALFFGLLHELHGLCELPVLLVSHELHWWYSSDLEHSYDIVALGWVKKQKWAPDRAYKGLGPRWLLLVNLTTNKMSVLMSMKLWPLPVPESVMQRSKLTTPCGRGPISSLPSFPLPEWWQFWQQRAPLNSGTMVALMGNGKNITFSVRVLVDSKWGDKMCHKHLIGVC